MTINKLGKGNYQTQSGFPVRIDDINTDMVYPIKGAYFFDQKWHHANWCEDGKFSHQFHSHLSLMPRKKDKRTIIKHLATLIRVNTVRFYLAFTAVLLDSISLVERDNNHLRYVLLIISGICYGLLIPNPNPEKKNHEQP